MFIGYDTTGNTSSQQSAALTVPTITTQPAALLAASPGLIAGLSISVASPSPATFQWYFNGALIPGATGDSLLLNSPTSANEGLYTVTVTNSLGSATSTASRLVIDADGNGLGDAWEQLYFGNRDQKAGDDFDGDQLSNLEELIYGTNPTVRDPYYWTAASGSFDDPANWNWKRVPGPSDAAFIDSGTFTFGTTGAAYKVNLTLNIAYSFSSTADTTLPLIGTWTLNSPVTIPFGRTLKVSSGTLILNGPTTLTGASLIAQGNNTQFIVNGLTTCTQPNNFDVVWRAGDSSVSNTGCKMSFPNLTSITGGITTGYSSYYFDLIGRTAGTLHLPALASISVPAKTGEGSSGVRLYGIDNGTLSAPVLNQFVDATPLSFSWLLAYTGGHLLVPQLTTPYGVQLDLSAENFDFQQFSSLEHTRFIRLLEGVAQITVSNIDYVREIYAINPGTKLSFPNVAGYTQPNNASVQWRAGEPNRNNAGCELNFTNLTTITGGYTTSFSSYYFDLIGRTGGTLNMPALASISVPARTGGGNSATRLYSLDSGKLQAARLTTFTDLSTSPLSRIEASANSTYRLTSLRQTGLQGIILSGITLLTGPINLQPSIITSPERIIAILGQSFSYAITASNQPVTRVATPLPSGLSIDTSTGVISGTPSAAGTFLLTLTAVNPDGTGTQPLTLVVTPATYGDYLTHAGTPSDKLGILDDPDHDGQSNLLEYAFGQPPMTSSTSSHPRLGLSGTTITFTYQRPRADVSYSVETTGNLNDPLSWTISGVTQGTVDAYGYVTATIPTTDVRRFVRLKVEMLP